MFANSNYPGMAHHSSTDRLSGIEPPPKTFAFLNTLMLSNEDKNLRPPCLVFLAPVGGVIGVGLRVILRGVPYELREIQPLLSSYGALTAGYNVAYIEDIAGFRQLPQIQQESIVRDQAVFVQAVQTPTPHLTPYTGEPRPHLYPLLPLAPMRSYLAMPYNRPLYERPREPLKGLGIEALADTSDRVRTVIPQQTMPHILPTSEKQDPVAIPRAKSQSKRAKKKPSKVAGPILEDPLPAPQPNRRLRPEDLEGFERGEIRTFDVRYPSPAVSNVATSNSGETESNNDKKSTSTK